MRAAALVLLLVAIARPALAFEEFEGTRAEGMGGATRAWALADSAPLLNPSGMSLVKAYNVEASYAYGSRLSNQFFHASVVDSTSALGLAGGLYYTYHLDDHVGEVHGHDHEAGVALSLPIGNYLALGATGKWFRLQGADAAPAGAGSGGITFDAGATLRPMPILSFAIVGVNMRDLGNGQAPQMLTYGAAYIPLPSLVLAVDGVTSYTRDAVSGRRGTGVKLGGEWAMAQRAAFRLGGGTDPMLGVGYLSAGASLLTESAAIDFGLRGDLFPMATGSERNVVVGVSLRLFVGAGQPGSAPDPESPSP
ncbi:MAG TPA: hypothetical protein VK989_08105 [Polyangia bacterium]|nr:hypothetical protein [Polyangia bacterium]